MSDDITGKPSAAKPGTDWHRVRDMTDAESHAAVIDDPEVEPTNDEFWRTAHVVRPSPSRSTSEQRKSLPLSFRPEIAFDPQNDDAIIWGDEGEHHFRLAIRRGLLLRKYGLKRYFDRAGAEAIIKAHRPAFERLAQDAYETGAFELIIG